MPATDSQSFGELCLTTISLSALCFFGGVFCFCWLGFFGGVFFSFLNMHIPISPKSCWVTSGSHQQLPMSLCASLCGFPEGLLGESTVLLQSCLKALQSRVM